MRRDREEDEYERLKATVVKEGYPVAIYRNQGKDVEMLRIDGVVGAVNFIDGLIEVAESGPVADSYYSAVSAAIFNKTKSSVVFTLGVLIKDGRSSFYWKAKGVDFANPAFKQGLRVLGFGEPMPEIDPFGMTSEERLKSIIIVKGSLERVGTGKRFLHYGAKHIDYNADQYDLWVGRPNEALIQGVIRSAVHDSLGPTLLHKGRIYVTVNFRRVALSGAGTMTAARTYAIGNTDARKEATIDSTKAQLHRNIIENFPNKSREGGIQVEIMVTFLYRKKDNADREIRAMCEDIDKVIKLVNSSTPQEDDANYRNSGLQRAKFNWGYIKPEEAFRLYVSQGFHKGKEEDFNRKQWSEDFSKEYCATFGSVKKPPIGTMVDTEGYTDRAMGIQDVGYLFWRAGPTAIRDMAASNLRGGLIVLPFYLSARNKLFKSLPKNLSMFATVEGRDVGFDPRYINEADYKDIMNRAHLRIYVCKSDRDMVIHPDWENLVYNGVLDEDGYKIPKGEKASDPRSAHVDGWVDESNGSSYTGANMGANAQVPGGASPGRSEAAKLFPRLKDGDVVKLFTEDNYTMVSRLKDSDTPVLGIVKKMDGSDDVVGPTIARKEGSRILVVGGSGGGKTTVAAPAALEMLEAGGSVVAADTSGDFLEKLMKIAMDRYGTKSGILDRIFVITVGNDVTPSIGSMNFHHPRINGMNRDLLWSIVSSALNAGRETLYGDAFGGPKIEQYVKAAVQVLYDLSPDSSLTDVKYILQNPEKGADILKNLKAATGKGADSAYDSIYSALKAQADSRYKDEFASSVRYVDGAVGSYPMKRMLNDRGSRFRFEDLLRPDKPTLVVLYFPASTLGDREASLLVSAYLTLFYALKVSLNAINGQFDDPLNRGKKLTYSDGKLLIIADEFQKYWNDMLKMALTEGRKQNISMMLLTQTIRVPDLNGKPLLESHRNDFNFVLVKGVKDSSDLKLLGLGNETTYNSLVTEFVDRINGVKGAFYAESPEVHGRVSTLYQISEHDPEFFGAVLKAFYKRYEELDSKDGMGRLRMLSDAQVEEMSQPLEDVDARKQFGIALDLYYLDKYYSNQVALGNLSTFNGKMLYGVGPFRRNFHMDVYFPEIKSNPEINAVLKQLVDNNCVRRDSFSDRMMLYGIQEHGVDYLKERLGSGNSGGGDEHRTAVLEIARNIVSYNYREFDRNKRETMVYVYPSVGGNGPDMYINMSEKPKKLENGVEIKFAFGEVQMGYRKALVVEKLNALPKGWGMIFYVPKADVVDFRKGLNNIVSEDLNGKDASEVLSRVFVQSIEDARQKLDALNEAVNPDEKAGPFNDNSQSPSGSNAQSQMGQAGNNRENGSAWGFNEEQTKVQLALLDEWKEKGDLDSLTKRHNWMKAFGVVEINDVGIPVDRERHNPSWTAPGGMKDVIKEVRKVGYAFGFKVLRREDVVVYTGIPGSGIPGTEPKYSSYDGLKSEAGSNVNTNSAGVAPEASQTPTDSATTENASEPAVTEEERKEIEKCENWNKMLFMSKQSWPSEKNIKEFSRQGDDVYIDVCRVADIILTMNRFMLLADATNGEKYRKYMESGGYFVINDMEFRTRIRSFLKLRGEDMAKGGKLDILLEDYLVKRGILVRFGQAEKANEYVTLVGMDMDLIRIVDLRAINEVFFPDFCKYRKLLLDNKGTLFIQVDKVVDRFTAH